MYNFSKTISRNITKEKENLKKYINKIYSKNPKIEYLSNSEFKQYVEILLKNEKNRKIAVVENIYLIQFSICDEDLPLCVSVNVTELEKYFFKYLGA